jgi:hypothetical protein
MRLGTSEAIFNICTDCLGQCVLGYPTDAWGKPHVDHT